MALRNKRKARAQPSVAYINTSGGLEDILVPGYTSLSNNPEVITCARKISGLISSMTIHLMENAENGDSRVKDGLARKINIEPYSLMTRRTWMDGIVFNMLVSGNGNAFVLPVTNSDNDDSYIKDLIPLEPSRVAFAEASKGYAIQYKGKIYKNDEILHFVLNPDPNKPYKGTGYKVALREVVDNLHQAAATKKGFMSSKWKPSVIIAIDGLSAEMEDEAGRRKILNNYVKSGEVGEPWLFPNEIGSIEQVKPLTLNDLAINDTVKLDKQTVAGIFGVPAFLLGVGTFNKDEFNNFITTTLMPIAQIIEQELTKKLLISNTRYFKFNPRALYAYDTDTLATVGMNMYTRGLMLGNEVRDWVGLPPDPRLNELVILENYIPVGMIGDQKKLKGGEKDDEK